MIDVKKATEADNATKIDPLHRVFVPIEGRNVRGQWTFRTMDRDEYYRDVNGCIRRKYPKVNCKEQKKLRRKSRP